MKNRKFYSTIMFFFLLSSLGYAQKQATYNAQKDYDCVKATQKLVGKWDISKSHDENMMRYLKLAEKYPDCPYLLSEIQHKVSFEKSIEYGLKALAIDPNYPTANHYLAEKAKHFGEYNLAIKHYEALMPLANFGQYKPYFYFCEFLYGFEEDIKTCKFLSTNSGQKYLPGNLSSWDALLRNDHSVKTIVEKSGFPFLRNLTLNIGSLLVNNSITGYDASIQYSLNLLDTVIEHKSDNGIPYINLNTIVDMLSIIISDNNLLKQVNEIYTNEKKSKLVNFPEPKFTNGWEYFMKKAKQSCPNAKLADNKEFKDRIKSIDIALQSNSNTNFTSTLLKDSLVYYQHAIESNPGDIKYHWGLASLLEYIGEYGKASQEFKWVIENSSDLKQQANARVHKITCRYMMANAGKKQLETSKQPDQKLTDNTIKQETQFAEVDGQKVDVSPQSISERSGWTYLKGLATSIAVAGSISGLGGDAKYVEYALNLLTKWIKAPAGQGVQTRNEFIAGMISTFASIIAKYDLTMKLDPIYNPTTSGLPSEGYAGNMQTQFEQGKFEQVNQEEGKRINVNDDITITEKTVEQNISGEYICISPEESTTGTHSSGHGVSQIIGSLLVTQNGNNLSLQTSSEVIVPPYNGTVSMTGYTTSVESIGQGVLNQNQATVLFTTTMNSNGYSITSSAGSHSATQNVPPKNETSQVSGILRVIGTDELELSSDSRGTTITSRYKRK